MHYLLEFSLAVFALIMFVHVFCRKTGYVFNGGFALKNNGKKEYND